MAANTLYLGVDFLHDPRKVRLVLIGLAVGLAVLGMIAPEVALAGNGTSGCHCGGGC